MVIQNHTQPSPSAGLSGWAQTRQGAEGALGQPPKTENKGPSAGRFATSLPPARYVPAPHASAHRCCDVDSSNTCIGYEMRVRKLSIHASMVLSIIDQYTK